jgi:hypothetical protein
MNSDFKDLLRIFAGEQVEYLVVGAYAVIHYTQPRDTKDIDLWIKPSVQNAARVARAFQKFFDIPLIEVTQDDLAHDGLQCVIGVPLCQIDFLTSLPGFTDFDFAWQEQCTAVSEGVTIHFMGINHLIHAKQTAARPQDIADLDEIRRAGGA